MTRPADVAAVVRRALRPDGTWFVADIKGRESFAADVEKNPMAALMYGMSVLTCMSSALSEPGGAGLGTLGLPEPRDARARRGRGLHALPRPRPRPPGERVLRASALARPTARRRRARARCGALALDGGAFEGLRALALDLEGELAARLLDALTVDVDAHALERGEPLLEQRVARAHVVRREVRELRVGGVLEERRSRSARRRRSLARSPRSGSCPARGGRAPGRIRRGRP